MTSKIVLDRNTHFGQSTTRTAGVILLREVLQGYFYIVLVSHQMHPPKHYHLYLSITTRAVVCTLKTFEITMEIVSFAQGIRVDVILSF